MTDNLPPRPIVQDAPGLTWRPSGHGWEARWRPRTDLVRRGYSNRPYRLWRGTELSDHDRNWISDNCNRMQAEMLGWARGAEIRAAVYDGTLYALCQRYQTDPDSRYRKLRYRTRENYDWLMKRIILDHGPATVGPSVDPDGTPVEGIKARRLLRWYEDWSGRGVTRAHSLMGMLRTLFGFGALYLEDPECERLCGVMHKMRFPQGGHREESITVEQVIAVRAEAHKRGFHSMALAQAFQFECTLRQKDVIGEWVPQSENGTSEVLRDQDKWLRGLRWSEIDQNMILTHVTSKRNKEVVIDLKLAPMVIEELMLMFGLSEVRRELLPASGPVVVDEYTSLPYGVVRWRRKWRQVATAAGVPKDVYNMDTRAGAITEATSSEGVSLEDARHAATHSNVSMTQRYSRESTKKVAKVMTLRVASRNKKD